MMRFSQSKILRFEELQNHPDGLFPDLPQESFSQIKFLLSTGCPCDIPHSVSHITFDEQANSSFFTLKETGITWNEWLHHQVIARIKSPQEIIITPFWKPFRFIDLFAGIGGIRLGFEAVGGQCVFSSEVDANASKTYFANFGEKPHGDITQINAAQIPDHDILLAGFPCQPFSIIGKQKGFNDTRGTLFFDIERILRTKKPTAFLLENVKQFRTHNRGETCRIVLENLRKLGYYVYINILNALDFGVAQKRERTFIVGFREPLEFRFPLPYGWYPDLQDVLEPEDQISSSLMASEYICHRRQDRMKQQGKKVFYPSIWHENKGGDIGIHAYSCALRHNASYNYLLVNGNRRLTGREMLRLQGFPENFQIVVDHTAIRSQAGNSVAVPVITAIAAEMVAALYRHVFVHSISSFSSPMKQKTLFEIGSM